MQIIWADYFESVHQKNTVFISFLLFISHKYVLHYYLLLTLYSNKLSWSFT